MKTSFSLSQLLNHNLSCTCASCDQAIWQAYEKDNCDSSETYYVRKNLSINGQSILLCCWCMALHRYIQHAPIYCDGNSPDVNDENLLNNFMEDNDGH